MLADEITNLDINISFDLGGRRWTLTTSHSASSYGRPVLVDDEGKAFGMADLVVLEDGDLKPAGDVVAGLLSSMVMAAYGL